MLKLPQSAHRTLNLCFPASHCIHCETQLKIWHNTPILSFCYLKGHCAFCHRKIPSRYFWVEVITGILSGYLAYHFGWQLSLIYALVFAWTLIALTVIDLQHQLLPDQLTLPLLWLGLLVNIDGVFTPLPSAIYGTVFGYLVFYGIYWLFRWIRKKEALGFGDMKLLAALGAWFGWQALPMVVLISALLGIGLYILLKLRKYPVDTGIPFGPCIALSGLIFLTWGSYLIKP